MGASSPTLCWSLRKVPSTQHSPKLENEFAGKSPCISLLISLDLI